ncbi:hypothetical protein [Leifsonia sp. WHRI 6310E]|uniref:hypothetical protein n=1 Tax=Leifsonia sp. WHRI 6310E TaxID=3162562 RepID=UPI0032EE9C29
MKGQSRKLISALIGMGAAVLLAVTTSLPATADGAAVAVPAVSKSASQTKDTLAQMQGMVDRWRPLSVEVTRTLAQKARSLEAEQGGLRVDYSRASAWQVDRSTRVVRIPAADGQPVLNESSLSVVFDESDAVVGTSEMIFTPVSEVSGRVQSWVDGALRLDQTVDAPGIDADAAFASRAYQKGDWWGNFNQCLSNAGIASWVIAGIALACSAICVVTVGAGCVACLGAASAGFSGTVSFCITTANLNS